MRRFKSTIFGLALTASILICTATGGIAQNSADGSLTVDGATTAIKYVYANEFDGDITIILTNNPIDREMIPDGVYSLGEQGKIRGLVFAVSSETKELLKGGLYKLINAIHFHPKWNRLGSIGNGVLTTSKFDAHTLTGRVATPSENELAGHKFSYDISFSVSLKQEPLELTITGKTDAPSRAFAAWGKALLAGDMDEYKKHASREIIEMLPEDPEELAFGIEMQQSMFPTVIEIVSSKITGKKAVLAMTGRRGGKISDGTVTMLQENGKWKVNKQSWESSVTQK